MSRTRFASVALFVLALASAGGARAQCPAPTTDPDAPTAVSCFDQDVDFHDAFAAIPSVTLDSGWVPASSPLQVRFALYVMAETAVDMGGTVVTSWPTTPRMRALSVAVPGRPGTGRLAMAYGIELVAQVRIHVSVAGVPYDWEGDIPIPGGIPTDLRLVGETTFDPFVLPDVMPRPIMVSDVTDSVPIVSVGIGSLAGGSIAGIDGGFELSARGMLTTTYQTQRIDIERALSPIIAEGAWVALPPESSADGFGASQDVAVLPHGVIGYDGVITLRPALYVTLLGHRWDLIALDVPLRVVDASTNTDFEPAIVHVPLPDVRLAPDEIDLGSLRVGELADGSIEVINDGEAELIVSLVDPGHDLTAMPSSMTIPPRSGRAMTIQYAPTAPEMLSTLVSLATNDPDSPLVSFRVLAIADAPLTPDAGPGDGGARSDAAIRTPPSTAGGCGCHAGGRSGSGGALLGLTLVAFVVARLRRRPVTSRS